MTSDQQGDPEDRSTSTGGQHSRLDRATVDLVVRLVLLGALIYWALILVGPFVLVVLWSAVLAVALYPAFAWLSLRLGGRPSAAAALITLAGLAVVVAPTAMVISLAAEDVERLRDHYAAGTLSIPPPPDAVRTWPVIGDEVWALWGQASSNLQAFIVEHGSRLREIGQTLIGQGASVALAVLQFTASIIIAGFLFRPAPAIMRAIDAFAHRVLSERDEAMIALAGSTIRNVSRGVIGVALLQAALSAVGMLIAGVPGVGPISILILVMGILNLGATLPIIAVAVWGWWLMDPLTALIFTAYMVPVGLMDNVLKPIVMAKGLGVPMVVVFLGVIAGAMQHGLIGLFLGPIVLAVFWVLLVEWVTGQVTRR